MTSQLLLCFDSPAPAPEQMPFDLTAPITTNAQSARASARIKELWALAEARWQEGGRPLRFTGCSYFVVDSRQASDRSAYLSEEENAEVHALTVQNSLYENDPYRAHERVVARLAMLRARRGAPAQAA